jgi:hypothetical protein
VNGDVFVGFWVGVSTVAVLEAAWVVVGRRVARWWARRDPSYIWRDHCGDECRISR